MKSTDSRSLIGIYPALRAAFFRTACLFFILFLTGCTCGNKTAPYPNILMISIDTLRRDHLGCYGYYRDTSPNIDRLAESGVVFDNMISSCSWTLPAHASMLTGRYPSSHGLQDDGVKLSPETPTLAEKLKELGYYNLAVVSHVYVSSSFGLHRGFDLFDDSLIQGGAVNPVASQVVDRLIMHAKGIIPKPYFAFIHFFDPHWSYTPPSPYNSRYTDPAYTGEIDGYYKTMWEYIDIDKKMSEVDRRQMIALYDGEIAYTDAQIGRLLNFFESQSLLENTVVIITADHGEEFKEHGRIGHGRTLYGEQLRVPLIVAGYPGAVKGQRRNDLVSPCDVMPTVLAMMATGPSDECQGESIMPKKGDQERIVFAESIRFGIEMWSARNRYYKTIYNLYGNKWEFYDLRADPLEQASLKADPSGGVLKAALESYMSSASRGWHIKLVAAEGNRLHCLAEISTEGEIVNPRHYFSDNIYESTVDFTSFELSRDGTKLFFNVEVKSHRGEVFFQTDPPQAGVTFKMNIDGSNGDAEIRLGRNDFIKNRQAITLTSSDPRVTGMPDTYGNNSTGIFVRLVRPADELYPKSDLSPEAIEHLRSLGYVQ